MQEQAKTLYHRNDPDTSREAAEKLAKSGELSHQEKLVCEAIVKHTRRRPGFGFTAKDLALWSDLDYYMISRRLSGLEYTENNPKGVIERTMYRREGSAVWRLKNENG